MFDNKIISLITYTLGAIFLLFMGYLVVTSIIDTVILYNLQTIIINVFSFIAGIFIVLFIAVCAGKILE